MSKVVWSVRGGLRPWWMIGRMAALSSFVMQQGNTQSGASFGVSRLPMTFCGNSRAWRQWATVCAPSSRISTRHETAALQTEPAADWHGLCPAVEVFFRCAAGGGHPGHGSGWRRLPRVQLFLRSVIATSVRHLGKLCWTWRLVEVLILMIIAKSLRTKTNKKKAHRLMSQISFDFQTNCRS